MDEIFDPIDTAVGIAISLGSLDEPDKLVCGLRFSKGRYHNQSIMHVVWACSMTRNDGASMQLHPQVEEFLS